MFDLCGLLGYACLGLLFVVGLEGLVYSGFGFADGWLGLLGWLVLIWLFCGLVCLVFVYLTVLVLSYLLLFVFGCVWSLLPVVYVGLFTFTGLLLVVCFGLVFGVYVWFIVY